MMQFRLPVLHQYLNKSVTSSEVLNCLLFILIFALIVAVILSIFELRRSRGAVFELATELALAKNAEELVDKYGSDFNAYIKATSERNPTRVRWREYLQERTDSSVFKKLEFSIGESHSVNRVYHDKSIHRGKMVTKESELILDQHLLRIVGSFSTDRELVELLYSLTRVPGELIKPNGCETKKISSPAGFELSCLYTIYNIEFKVF